MVLGGGVRCAGLGGLWTLRRAAILQRLDAAIGAILLELGAVLLSMNWGDPMTRSWRILILLLLTVALPAGCAADVSSELAGSATEAVTTPLPATGFVPYPVRVDASGNPVEVNGSPQPAWDGTLADLLAADALALCGASFLDESEEALHATLHADKYLDALLLRMDLAFCEPTAGSNSGATIAQRWRTQRTELSACNVNTNTLQPATIADDVSDEARYTLPPPSSLTVNSLDGNPATIAAAHDEAQREVRVAQLNMCMAMKLRESLTSADVLVASGAEQLVLLEVIRQRAQIAMQYFALMGLAFSNPDGGTDTVLVRQTFIPILRAWAKQGADLPELGKDFAQTVQLYVDTVSELARLLVRRAGANADDSDLTRVPRPNATRADREWGPGAWRNRLHNLLFGGDPLGTGFGEESLIPDNHTWGTKGGYPTKPYAREDVRAPEVDVLLGLARSADAFYVPSSGFVDDAIDFLYRDVDAYLNEQECLAATPQGPCSFTVADVPALASFDDSLLWKRFKITPDHAGSLARMLVAGLPRRGATGPSDTVSDLHGALHVFGEHQVVAAPPGVPTTGADWYHFDPGFTVLPFDSATYGSAFHNFVGAGIPLFMSLYGAGSVQGFTARVPGAPFFLSSYPGTSNLVLRYTGSVAMLTSVRDAILTGTAIAQSGNPQAQAYFDFPTKSVEGISAAVGRTSVAVRPWLFFDWLSGECPEYLGSPSFCYSPTQATDGNLLGVLVSVTVPTGTAAPELVALNTGTNADERGVQTTAALGAEFQSLGGFTRADLDATTGTTPALSDPHAALGVDRHTYIVTWPAAPNIGGARVQYPTLLLRFEESGVVQYKPLSDALPFRSRLTTETRLSGSTIPVYRSNDGKYLAYGGFLGEIAQRSRTVLPGNWSRPSRDGFGFPVGWVPPSSPELTGAAPGEDAVAYYLKVARAAAEEATAAVDGAVEALIAQEADAQLQNAADKKAEVIPELEREALCGGAGDDCDVPAVSFSVAQPSIGCSSDFCDQARSTFTKLVPSTTTTTTLVLATLVYDVAPTFSQFSGGALQLALIEEWKALSALLGYFDVIDEQIVAWDAKVIAANAQLAAAQASNDSARQQAANECSEGKAILAMEAGFSYGNIDDADVGYTYDDEGMTTSYNWSVYGYGSKNFSTGPLLQQLNLCDQARAALAPAAAEAHAADLAATAVIKDAMAWLAAQAIEIDQLVGAVGLARAHVENTVASSKRAVKLAELDAELLTAGRTQTFGVYRRFHHYDLWRARALLENARRLSATARRAIEAKYVVDLSTMHQDEPFVSSPSSWADEVYDFDLDAPSSVGLSTVPGRGDQVYPNKLVDYVRNLESFVQGYAIARPTAVAKTDSEIVSFTGPDVVETIEILDQGTVTEQPVLDFDSRGWQFHCAETDSWVPHPAIGEIPAVTRADQACGPANRPDRARMTLRLDAWGRLYGLETDPPYDARHNTRWQRFTVNLVGTGIRDCTLAKDPLTCYSESFIRFDLKHVGPSWVTNFHQEWRWLNSGLARVEGGKAIAAEEWLDPLVNGWSQSFVNAAARTELMDRPLYGSYELELLLTPDVRLDRIERVQVLLETTYWLSGE